MKIIQVKLRNNLNETLTTWVDVRPDLKLGSYITLKDFKPEVRWQVTHMYKIVRDSKDFDWHRKWTNNI